MNPHTGTPLTWLVTGCSGGIGLAIVRHVLSQGHNIIATSRNLSKTPDLVTEIRGHANGRWIQLDTSWSREEIEATIKDAWRMFPRGIDVVINNAGMDVLGSIEDIAEEQAKAMFDVNFWGVLRVCKAVIPLMRDRGSGTVVNVSSALGVTNWPAVAMYGTTKWAVEGMSHGLSMELAPFGIRVLTVQFGAFRTDFLGPTMQMVEPSDPYKSPHPVDEALEEEHRKNGRQPGDPGKGAARIFDVVTGTGMGKGRTNLMRIPLGKDSWELCMHQNANWRANFEACKEIAMSTDHDDVNQ